MAGVRIDGTAPFAEPSARCYAGAARADMTPPVGMYTRMWGAALHDCHTAVHKPLLATALAIAADAAAPPRLILGLDLCLLGVEEMQEIRAAVLGALGLAHGHQLVVSLSHTHAGPGVLSRQPIWARLPGGQLLGPYLDKLVAACVDACARAVAALEPAWLTFASASCKLACNRDTWDAKGVPTAAVGLSANASHVDKGGDDDAGGGKAKAKAAAPAPGQWVCGYGADSVVGPADDALMVVRVCRRCPPSQRPPQPPDHSGNTLAHGVSADGRPPPVLAVLLNYGCHPTTLGPGNTHISPDYIGAARELLEAEFGGLALFLQGASGDTGPMISYAGDPAAADRNGRWLGHAAAAAVTGMLPPGTGLAFDGAIVSGANLAGWRETQLDGGGDDATAGTAAAAAAAAAPCTIRSEDLVIELPLKQQTGLSNIGPELAKAEAAEAEVRAAGGDTSVAYRDARAIADRWRRVAAREALRHKFTSADGAHFVAHVSIVRVGDVYLVGMPGEPYQDFQKLVRARCAGLPVLVAGLCNESPLSYTLPSAKCGCGTNQDEQMCVQAGSLELMAERISERILAWQGGEPAKL